TGDIWRKIWVALSRQLCGASCISMYLFINFPHHQCGTSFFTFFFLCHLRRGFFLFLFLFCPVTVFPFLSSSSSSFSFPLSFFFCFLALVFSFEERFLLDLLLPVDLLLGLWLPGFFFFVLSSSSSPTLTSSSSSSISLSSTSSPSSPT